jgi:hypothetical protein
MVQTTQATQVVPGAATADSIAAALECGKDVTYQRRSPIKGIQLAPLRLDRTVLVLRCPCHISPLYRT